MPERITRRGTLTGALRVAGYLALSDWTLPALAQGETDAPFTDYPSTFSAGGTGSPRRTLLQYKSSWGRRRYFGISVWDNEVDARSALHDNARYSKIPQPIALNMSGYGTWIGAAEY